MRTPESRGVERREAHGGLFWALCIAIPVMTILSTHLLMRTGYTGDVFHLQGFLDQYNSGIYRYRLLGRELVLFVYRQLMERFADRPFPMPRDANATLLFYLSNVAVNAVCFFFSNVLFLWLLSGKDRAISDLHLAEYLFLTLLEALAMAVVTPYDQLTYVFLFVAFLGARASKEWLAYLLVGIAAVAGSLNRETEFLVTPALLSIAIFTRGESSRRYTKLALYHLALFACVYVGLRVFIPGSHLVAAGVSLGGKWALESGMVLALLFYIGTLIATRMHYDVRPTVALLILSTPYVVTVLLSGALRELRLLIPMLLCQMFVYAQLEFRRAAGEWTQENAPYPHPRR